MIFCPKPHRVVGWRGVVNPGLVVLLGARGRAVTRWRCLSDSGLGVVTRGWPGFGVSSSGARGRAATRWRCLSDSGLGVVTWGWPGFGVSSSGARGRAVTRWRCRSDSGLGVVTRGWPGFGVSSSGARGRAVTRWRCLSDSGLGDCESGLTGVRGVVVRGAGPGCNSVEVSERLARLKEELVALTERERELDEHKTWVQQSISNVTDDVHNHQYPLATLVSSPCSWLARTARTMLFTVRFL